MEPLPNDAPEDARPIPAEVRLRTLTPAGHIALAFPFAFIPPVVLALALANVIPAAACWAIAVVGTAAIWLKLRGRPSVGFTADALVVESLFGRRRVPWSAIRSVAFDDVTDSDTHEVVYRRITVRYLRDPDRPLPDMPTRLGDFREWNRQYFRSVNLPLSFPTPQEETAQPDKPASRRTRRRDRMRAIVLEELAKRGYNLSNDT